MKASLKLHITLLHFIDRRMDYYERPNIHYVAVRFIASQTLNVSYSHKLFAARSVFPGFSNQVPATFLPFQLSLIANGTILHMAKTGH